MLQTASVDPPGLGDEQLLRTTELATRLAISLAYAKVLVAKRLIRTVRIGKSIRIPESAVRDFIRERSSPAAAPGSAVSTASAEKRLASKTQSKPRQRTV
jgi:excisionase family DNA binding protein